MESGNVSDDCFGFSGNGNGNGCGGPVEDSTTLHFDNEMAKSGQPPFVKSGPLSRSTNVRRRVPSNKSGSDSSPTAAGATVDETKETFEKIRKKLSAIHGPPEISQFGRRRGGEHHDESQNNNSDNLYSTPVGRGDLKFCAGLGESPEVDSGFVTRNSSTGLDTLGQDSSGASSNAKRSGNRFTFHTPVKQLLTSPSKQKSYHARRKTSHTRFATQDGNSTSGSPMSASDKKRRLFESSSAPQITVLGHKIKLDEVIPLLVLCFVATSAVVTLTTLTGALRRSHMASTPNGKYKSMEFANEKMSEGSEDSFAVYDEYGNSLGGKRAAIQFAFDLKAGNYDVPNHSSDYDLGTEHFNAVELLRKIDELTAASAKSGEQAANEVPDGEDGSLAEAEGLSESERKERLLKLINSFGQPFATASKPQPLPTKRAKRGAKKRSKNSNPLKSYGPKITKAKEDSIIKSVG